MSRGDAAARASTLIDLGRPTEALAVLGPALAASPDSNRLHCLAAQAHLARGDATGALRSANAAIAAAPNNEWGHRLASLSLMRLKNHEAIPAAEEAVRLAPHAWQTHHQLALALSEGESHHRAMDAAREAVRLHPHGAEPHFALGLASMRAGKRKLARDELQRVVEIEPNHAAALNNLAVLKLRRGRILQASHQLSGSLAADPHSPIAQYNVLVVARRLLKRLHIALAILNIALFASVPTGTEDEAGHSVPSNEPTPHWFSVATPLMIIAFVGSAIYVDRRLPRSLRGYLRRLPLSDWTIGYWLGPLVVMLGLMVAETLPVSPGARRDMHTLTLFILLLAVIASWSGRAVMHDRLAAARSSGFRTRGG